MNAAPSIAKPAPDTPAPASPPPARPRRAWPRLLVLGGVAVAVLAGAWVAGTVPRLRQEQAVNAQAAAVASSLPRVTVATAQESPADNQRVLPGNALPLLEAALFPRVTGYVKTRLVDIGDRVKVGQLLAVIDAPDIDDQLNQAKADLEQAKANLGRAKADEGFAMAETKRYHQLVGTMAISQQDYEKSVQAYGVAKAAVGAAEASIKVYEAAVQRNTDLQAFEKITAPFQGVITSRNIDPGDLVSANSTARELFHIMRTDVLRVFVNVPQVFATGIRVGQDASVYLRDDPSQQFAGKVTRTSDALDPNTRTLLTEVQVPNPVDALRSGMFLEVKFVFRRVNPTVRIPAAAIVVRNGPRKVAVLDAQHTVHYHDVQPGRDFGDQIEILTGLKAGETVVVHPGDDIPEGTVVEPVPLPK